jgi:hypothetical protein
VLWADGTTACLGLEPTIAAYLDHLVESFQAVKRVLRSDGTCWVVIGDSYNSGSNFNHDRAGLKGRVGYSEPEKGSRTLLLNLQPLDLCLVPSRLALALQADNLPESSALCFLALRRLTHQPLGPAQAPKQLKVVCFPDGKMEFQADGLRIPITERLLKRAFSKETD